MMRLCQTSAHFVLLLHLKGTSMDTATPLTVLHAVAAL